MPHASIVPAPPEAGAYLPLHCDDEEIIVGLVADAETSQALAKHFIQAEESETLSPEDMADSVKEIINVAAGLLKTETAKQNRPLKLGLPFFLEGKLKPIGSQEIAGSDIVIGGYHVRLQVLRNHPRVLDLIKAPEGKEAAARSPQEWLSEALTAAFRFTVSTLKVEKYQVKKIMRTFTGEAIAGAYIPMIGEDDSVLLGLLTDETGLREIARGFLQLPESETLDSELMMDAIKEVLNVLSGMIKTQLFKPNTPYLTNLPFFVDGYIEVTDKQDASAALIEIGKVQTYIVIIKQKSEVAG
ncbi:MAG: chemotaxis protein CheX [Candidatus Firestonebacteria bacterium]|nr:chemotaxis protein CheX [Candidatus Firestonebacteria bacterium]